MDRHFNKLMKEFVSIAKEFYMAGQVSELVSKLDDKSKYKQKVEELGRDIGMKYFDYIDMLFDTGFNSDNYEEFCKKYSNELDIDKFYGVYADLEDIADECDFEDTDDEYDEE